MFGKRHVPVQMTFEESLPAPLIDDPVVGVTYKGYSEKIGVRTNEEKWLIMRTTTIGTEIITEYAEGSVNFDKVWDDRATYDYSR